jgi:putative transposase
MYRILASHGELRERRDQLRHPCYAKPELLATGPNQVWSWDITKLLGPVKWTYFYLYVVLDIFSRYVVGWMVAREESTSLAQSLILASLDKQGVVAGQLTIHSDRGPVMKSVALLLADLGVTKSHSRPYVSDDNPFSEAQFRTLKYRPDYPGRFGCIEDARNWCRELFRWYNTEHYHSGLALLTPHMVHYGLTRQVLERRQATLLAAYAAHPERFVRRPPAVSCPPAAVWINPPRSKSSGPLEVDPPLAARLPGASLEGGSTGRVDLRSSLLGPPAASVFDRPPLAPPISPEEGRLALGHHPTHQPPSSPPLLPSGAGAAQRHPARRNGPPQEDGAIPERSAANRVEVSAGLVTGRSGLAPDPTSRNGYPATNLRMSEPDAGPGGPPKQIIHYSKFALPVSQSR